VTGVNPVHALVILLYGLTARVNVVRIPSGGMAPECRAKFFSDETNAYHKSAIYQVLTKKRSICLSVRKSLFTVAEHHKISAAWGRIFFLFGPHEGPNRLVSSAIRALLDRKPFEASTGDQVRDFLHVEDVARSFVALLDSRVTGDVNIASGRESSVAEVLSILGQITGRPDLIRLGAKPKQPNEPPRLVASIRRLRDEVGVEYEIPLEQRLADTVAWWKTELAR